MLMLLEWDWEHHFQPVITWLEILKPLGPMVRVSMVIIVIGTVRQGIWLVFASVQRFCIIWIMNVSTCHYFVLHNIISMDVLY